MPQIQTTHFENLDYTEESVFQFPAGIPGFEQERQFLFVEQPATKPLIFIQSLARPDLCFLALPVHVIDPGYRFQVTPEDLQALDLPAGRQPEAGSDVLCLALLSLTDLQPPTVNLLAPIVVNLQARKAVQAIQFDTEYSHRCPLSAAPQETLCL